MSSNDSNCSKLPAHWRMVRLGEVYRLTKKPPGLRLADFDTIPFVPMDLVPISQTIFNQYILKQPSAIGSGTYFEPGDMLLAKITPSFENGKQGIIAELPIPFGMATTEVIPIHGVDGVSDEQFLFYYLLRPSVRLDLAGKMEGSTGRQRLSASTLMRVDIPLPPFTEQRTIVSTLQAVEQAIAVRRQEMSLGRVVSCGRVSAEVRPSARGGGDG